MMFHRVEVYPLALKNSQRTEAEQQPFGFIIKPPLRHIVDPELLSKAAERVQVRHNIGHATVSMTNATATYGTFETFETYEESQAKTNDQIAQDFKAVLDRAMGEAIEFRVKYVETPEL